MGSWCWLSIDKAHCGWSSISSVNNKGCSHKGLACFSQFTFHRWMRGGWSKAGLNKKGAMQKKTSHFPRQQEISCPRNRGVQQVHCPQPSPLLTMTFYLANHNQFPTTDGKALLLRRKSDGASTSRAATCKKYIYIKDKHVSSSEMWLFVTNSDGSSSVFQPS